MASIFPSQRAVRRSAVIFIVLAAAFLCGCAKSPSLGAMDPIFVGRAKADERWDMALAKKLRRPYCDVEKIRASYAQTTDDANGSARKKLRNSMIHTMFAWIDEYHENFKIHLYAVRASEDTMFDLAVLGLSAAGTVAGGEALKSVLAATAAAVTGTKLAVNKNFFYEQTITAIVAQIDARRNLKKLQILSRMNQTDDEFPLIAAEQQMLEYLYSGSLVNALVAITADASTKKRNTEGALANFKGDYVEMDPNAQRIRDWLEAGDDPGEQQQRLDSLNEWLNNNAGQRDGVVPDANTWLYLGRKDEYAAAVADPNLGIDR